MTDEACDGCDPGNEGGEIASEVLAADALEAASGPQLTAGEAKAAMLGLEEIWKDFLPHTLESSSLDDAENAYRKLSLIADGEKP